MALLDELKRRKVIRAAVVYGAAAFAVLEFADIAFPRLGLPDRAVNAVLWLGILGFPIALGAAWTWDLRRDPRSGGARGWLSFPTVGVALVLVVLGVGAGRWWGDASREPGLDLPGLAAPRGPSIAVMPFANLSDDPGQAYFPIGLAEDISTALSRFTGLRVISSRSTASYDDSATDAAEVGRAFGVRYVLRGSVRRDAERVRVAARLQDSATGSQLWAETYDRDLSVADLFEVQDDIAQRVVGTIADPVGVIARAGLAEARRRPPDRFDTYDCVLRGDAYLEIHTKAMLVEARDCLERAVEVEPDYADAWAHLAYLYREEFHHRYATRPDALERAGQAGRRAVELDATNPMAHYALAMIQFSEGDFESGAASAERAVALNPNDSTTLAALALYLAYTGHWERGLAVARRARLLNPQHPGWLNMVFAAERYWRGDYEAALQSAVKVGLPGDTQQLLHLAAIYGQLGRTREARAAIDELTASDPSFAKDPVGEVRRYFYTTELSDAYLDGLRKAGLSVEPDG